MKTYRLILELNEKELEAELGEPVENASDYDILSTLRDFGRVEALRMEVKDA